MSNAGALRRYDDYDRHLEHLERQAAIMAKMPGLKAEIAGKPDAVAAIALSLDAYGFRITVPAINMAFDWIVGRAEPSTRFYVALARLHGWRLAEKQPTTRELAVAVATKPGEEPIERRWTLEDAIESHRLDAWVEAWRTNKDGRKFLNTYVVRINGQPATWAGDLRVELEPERLPDWARTELEANRVKRYEAWWNYRVDMMLKSAFKRAAVAAIPDIILGAPSEHDFASPAAGRGSPPVGEAALDPDDDIADAEIVDDQDLGGAAHQDHRAAETRHSAPAPADHYRASEPTPPHVHDDAPESRGLVDDDDPTRPF